MRIQNRRMDIYIFFCTRPFYKYKAKRKLRSSRSDERSDTEKFSRETSKCRRYRSLRATFARSLLPGKLIASCLRSQRGKFASERESRRLALIGSFTRSKSPSATRARVEICRPRTDMRNTCKMRLSHESRS